MIRAKRHKAIIDALKEEPIVKVSDLAQRFEVAESTIRRDLEELESRDVVRREYGCAMLNRNWEVEPPFQERQILHREEKALVGRLAATQIRNGETIFIDGGTTTEFVIPHIRPRKELTVVTCGFNIATLLLNSPDIHTILVGGTLDPVSQTMIPLHGDEIAQLRGIRLTKAFMSAGGVSGEFGVTNRLVNRIPTKIAAMGIASESLLVVDGSKIGTVTVGFVAAAEAFSTIVTDDSAPSNGLEELEKLGIRMLIASPESQRVTA